MDGEGVSSKWQQLSPSTALRAVAAGVVDLLRLGAPGLDLGDVVRHNVDLELLAARGSVQRVERPNNRCGGGEEKAVKWHRKGGGVATRGGGMATTGAKGPTSERVRGHAAVGVEVAERRPCASHTVWIRRQPAA